MIDVENLTKDYGDHRALDDISFSVEKGEILGFLGPNGAGKTTTMRILTCYSPPTKGKVMVAGHDCFEDSLNARRKIGYLPERVPLYEDMRVDEYLSFVAKIKGMPSRDTKHKVVRIMDDCGLSDVSRKMINSISRGYRQRVGIAQALVNDPEVLVLDEPTVGLDPKQIKEIRSLIKELAGKHTVILSTHILPEVSLLCNRVIIINKGKLVAVDTPENLTSGNLPRVFLRIGGDVVDVEKALAGLSGVKSAERELTASKDTCGFIVTFDNEKKARKNIHSMIDENSWDLIEIRPMEMSLEDVFIKLVTKESA